MGYETLIRGLVKTVLSPQFESMKLNIQHTPWIGDDGKGSNSYGSPQTLRALVDFEGGSTARYTSSGLLIAVVAILMFLDPIPETTPNAGKIREGPIDSRDILTLPDGSTAPIADSGSGFADPLTGNPFVTTIVLGTVTRG